DLNDQGFPTAASASSVGQWIVSRTGSSSLAIYKNGNSLSTSSTSSFAPTSNTIYVGSRNANGSFFTSPQDQISIFYVGSGLSSGQASSVSALFKHLHDRPRRQRLLMEWSKVRDRTTSWSRLPQVTRQAQDRSLQRLRRV